MNMVQGKHVVDAVLCCPLPCPLQISHLSFQRPMRCNNALQERKLGQQGAFNLIELLMECSVGTYSQLDNFEEVKACLKNYA